MKTTDFSARLRSLREAAGLTQQQLADKLQVDRVTVNRWEAGDRFPGLHTRQALSRALGVEIDPPAKKKSRKKA